MFLLIGSRHESKMIAAWLPIDSTVERPFLWPFDEHSRQALINWDIVSFPEHQRRNTPLT